MGRKRPGTNQGGANNLQAANRIARSLARQGYRIVGILPGAGRYVYDVMTSGRKKKGRTGRIIRW